APRGSRRAAPAPGVGGGAARPPGQFLHHGVVAVEVVAALEELPAGLALLALVGGPAGGDVQLEGLAVDVLDLLAVVAGEGRLGPVVVDGDAVDGGGGLVRAVDAAVEGDEGLQADVGQAAH